MNKKNYEVNWRKEKCKTKHKTTMYKKDNTTHISWVIFVLLCLFMPDKKTSKKATLISRYLIMTETNILHWCCKSPQLYMIIQHLFSNSQDFRVQYHLTKIWHSKLFKMGWFSVLDFKYTFLTKELYGDTYCLSDGHLYETFYCKEEHETQECRETRFSMDSLSLHCHNAPYRRS